MKKRFYIILLIILSLSFIIVFSSCNMIENAPIFRGLSVSSADISLSQRNDIVMLNAGNDNGLGNDIAPDAEAENDYIAEVGEDILITINLINPREYEILSITLDSKKYQSYQFQEGSDSEHLILKINVGDTACSKEYSLDNIKYVSGNKIRDVEISGDRTVKVEIREKTSEENGDDQNNSGDIGDENTGDVDDTTTDDQNNTGEDEENDSDNSDNEVVADSGDFVFELKEDGNYKIIDYIGNHTIITLPSEYQGKTVNELGNSAFDWNYSIESVTFPDCITSIDCGAFYSCTSLHTVVFGEDSNLKSIGNYAFDYCSSLYRISITSEVESIGFLCFDNCDSLTSINVDENNAFYRSENGVLFNKEFDILIRYPQNKPGTSYVIPDSIKEISIHAFFGCYVLKEVTIPEGVIKIDNEAFIYCFKLEHVYIPESVTYIGEWCFTMCPIIKDFTVNSNNNYYKSVKGSLYDKSGETFLCYPSGKEEDSFTVPYGVKYIGLSAFSLSKLKNIILSDSVLKINDNAFYQCKQLENITLSENLIEIGSYVFFECEKLETIIIPEKVLKLGFGFFISPNLKEITILAATPPILPDSLYNSEFNENIIIYVPLESLEFYKTGRYWDALENQIFPLTE